MLILGKKISLNDFIPPIFPKLFKLIWRLIRGSSEDKTFIKPFVSPALGSYSQFNEDLLIDLLLMSKNNGFYVDVGANDPTFNSNTNRFYLKGWSGINIDPNLESYKNFCVNRARDINLNIGVGPRREKMIFYQVVGDSTLSSFNKEIAVKMSKRYDLSIAEKEIDVLPLRDVLNEHLKGRQIDFMSVDAEGFDLEVLKSNDWEKYRPSLLMVEINNQYNEILNYMTECNYALIFNNPDNAIFVNNEISDNILIKAGN